jgi:hypothetical protein
VSSGGHLLGHYRLLAAHVSLHVDDEVVGTAAAALLHQFRVDDGGGSELRVERSAEGFVGTLDGRPFFRAGGQRECVTYLIWRLNELVAETPCEHLLVHASVAGRNGQALLFPGVSGAGKSTLIAALVRAGLSYLSDELAPIPLGSSSVLPYPRSITLEQGSWPAFPELAVPGRSIRAIDQWFVPPEHLRPGCVDRQRRTIAAIIFPRAEPGATTTVDEIGRAEALMRLTRNTVNLTSHGAPGFHTLAEIVRHVPVCAEMISGSVAGAVEAILAGPLLAAVSQRAT